MRMYFELRSRPVVRALFSIVAVLVVIDVAVKVLKYQLGYDTLLGFARLFDVGNESNIPTWYSSTQLALAALLLTAIAVDTRARRAPYGMELVEGWWNTHRGVDFSLQMINTVEEGGEMLGITLFIRTLLLYLEEERAGRAIVSGSHESEAAPSRRSRA